ncbi:MAG: TolC family protein, partial [Gemmataceae bacterium]|nr:TolC family protein [Gemmataceae bacterium]
MMRHWRAMLMGAALACAINAGCTRPLFIAESDLQRLGDSLPPALETQPQKVIQPNLADAPTPPDVRHPDRPPRYITLEECLAIGLENGNTNSRLAATANGGTVDDTLASAGLTPTQISESIRVLALQPAIAQTYIENQLSRFDVQWVSSFITQNTDNFQQGLQSFTNGINTVAATGLFKALPTGGFIHTGFQTEYRLLSTPPLGNFGVLNPSYTTRALIGIELPLWQNYGVEINQLLRASPNPVLLNVTGLGQFLNRQNQLSPFNAPGEGILIARLRHDQQKAELERQLNALVVNIEQAYWKLYQAYGNLFAYEEVLRIAHRSWLINKSRFDIGRIGPAEYYPILAQYEEFRGERLGALANVLEKERHLRGLMGLPYDDGTRLVPITPPTLAPYQPDFAAALKDALERRPELAIARENVRIAQMQLMLQKNFLKPDARAFAQYSPVGFGNRLDGNGTVLDGGGSLRTNNALQSLISDHYNDWTIGLSLSVPLGYRAEFANVRAARLALAQNYYALKDQEERTKRIVTTFYQDLSKWYDLIEIRRQERKAWAESVEARFKEAVAGKATFADFMLDMQRRLAQAQLKEFEAIAEYNSALARFEWAKGTLLAHNNIFIAEGPLPEIAHRRAVDHERERSLARVCRERPRPIDNPACFVEVGQEVIGPPQLINLEVLELPPPAEPTAGSPSAGAAAGPPPRPTTAAAATANKEAAATATPAAGPLSSAAAPSVPAVSSTPEL